MKLSHEIKPFGRGYWYLASPFTKYPLGHEQAWLDVSRIKGELLLQNIYTYSPVCETWGTFKVCNLPPDHKFWHGDNMTKILPALGIIVCKLQGYDESDGIADEVADFRSFGKPIVWLDPYST